MSKIKKFFKDCWLGLKLSAELYLSGKTGWGKF